MKVFSKKKNSIALAVLAALISIDTVSADRLGKSSSSSTAATTNEIETARLLQQFEISLHVSFNSDEDADIAAVVQNAINELAGEKPDPTHHSYGLYKKKCLAVLHLLDSHYPGYNILTKYVWLCGADKEDDGEDEASTPAPTDKAATSSPSKTPSFAPTKAPSFAPLTSSPTVCTDMPDWVDFQGDNCSYYELVDEPGCPVEGWIPGREGFGPAAFNCCHCKQGSGDGCFPRACNTTSDCCNPADSTCLEGVCTFP